MPQDQTQSLRDHLLELLKGGHAHLRLDKALAGLPPELRGAKAPGLPHTIWQILEHLRLAQWDILEFSRDEKHVSPEWPAGYWPRTEAPPDDAAWEKSLESFQRDLQAMQDLVADPKTDLYAKLPWGDGQTVLREAMMLADHNAYHLGQIVSVRQALGAWE
ncbi:MAG TPA: DinB family protein [Thermoanaerobaculia bacterium]